MHTFDTHINSTLRFVEYTHMFMCTQADTQTNREILQRHTCKQIHTHLHIYAAHTDKHKHTKTHTDMDRKGQHVGDEPFMFETKAQLKQRKDQRETESKAAGKIPYV